MSDPGARDQLWQIFTCAGLCWGGRSSVLSKVVGTRLVTYADDLVILCRRGSAETALHHLRAIMGKLKLTARGPSWVKA